MPDVDVLSAQGGAGIDEGWFEGSLAAELGVTAGLHGSLCHGIDVGANIAAIAEAKASMRLLVLGGDASVGAQASAGVRGRLTLTPDLFDTFGLNVQLEAAAEVAAWARLGISLQFDMIEDLASNQLDGLALDLFKAFLAEVDIGGGVMGKVAYSAMAKAWLAASGSFAGDAPGFVIGGGWAVGLKGGSGCDFFVKLGFENPRRFFTTATDLIVEHVVEELGDLLPPFSEVGIELLRLLAPVGMVTAYDIGQQSLAGAAFDPNATFDAFLEAFSTALQQWIVDKAADAGAGLFAALIDEALLRIGGVDLTDAQTQQLEIDAQALITALSDGDFGFEDLDELVDLGTNLGAAVDPELVERFERPAGIMWTSAALGNSLRDVARAYASAGVSLGGGAVGVEGAAAVHAMPALADMPEVVKSDYRRVFGAGFDPSGSPGASLPFVQALDYLTATGLDPLLRTYAPGAVEILDRLGAATGVSPGQVAELALYGVTQGGTGRPELYTRLADFVRSAVVEVVRTRVFEPLADAVPDPAVQLYIDEVLAPSLDLMVEFVFGQLDELVDDPGGWATTSRLVTIRGGASALLYKVIARNLVVIEQILTQVITAQSVVAFGELEDLVRSDETSALMVATLDHVDEVLQSISDWVPFAPSSTGLTTSQVAAVQTFAAEMLSMGQELFGTSVFTSSRMNRKRTATLDLMLSFETQIDWTNPDLLDEAFSALQECTLPPEMITALTDLLSLQFEMLVHMGNIALRRVPGPVTALVLALTGVDLEDLDQRRVVEQARITTALAGLVELLGELATAIGEFATAMADALLELAGDLASWLAATGNAGWSAIRTAIVAIGEQLVDAASATLDLPDQVRDAWALTVAGVVDVAGVGTSVIVDGWVDDVADVLSDMVDDVLATLGAASNATQGVSTSTAAAALADGVDGVLAGSVPLLPSILIPNPANLLQSVTVTAADVRRALLESLLGLPGVAGLAEQIAAHSTASARHARDTSRQQEELARQEHVQQEERDLGPADNVAVHIASPAAIAAKLDRLSAYGPEVPLLVHINRARPGWPAHRIQVALNGRLAQLPEDAFIVESNRVTIDWMFQLGQDGLSPGLNTIEISILADDDTTLRETVSFMVDPSAKVTDDDIAIEPLRSQFDSPGNDHQSVLEEYVALRAGTSGSVDLQGWRLQDRKGHTYTFGPGSIGAGRLLRVRTGGEAADDTRTDVHWGRRRAVWNNRGDTVLLIDAEGVVRAQHVYGGTS